MEEKGSLPCPDLIAIGVDCILKAKATFGRYRKRWGELCCYFGNPGRQRHAWARMEPPKAAGCVQASFFNLSFWCSGGPEEVPDSAL